MPETTIQTPTLATSPVVAKQNIKAGVFTGMLQRFQLNSYNTMIACSISHHVAHKVATDYGSDLGRLMSSDANLASKIGKANDKGEARLSISGGGKIAITRSMSIVRVCQQLHDLYKEQLLGSRELPTLATTLQEYIAECELWSENQEWEKRKLPA